ncbi:hypothetical protein [Pseudomonas phage vB_PaeP_4029]|nr:hypothetical protein [Pseudomonas phage vB_PaeP_4029]UYE96506.1 hypothetical protein [Pseudomonas phage vB_PaeP_4032]UYE96592.1 hypothetical protein [Pseudomonas phage vB_PaeP_4034]
MSVTTLVCRRIGEIGESGIAFTVHLNVHLFHPSLYLSQPYTLSSLSLLHDTHRIPISTWVVSDVPLHLR